MNKNVFQQDYAELYDLLYEVKDYKSECDLLEALFSRFAEARVSTVLDLGCGTGGHALLLAERGYSVTGADRSSEMLAVLKRKAIEKKLNVPVISSAVQQLQVGRTFDACVSLFAVLCYQHSNSEVEEFLRAVARHSNPGGIFIFDFWYGPAVLALRPEPRVKELEKHGERVIRTATPTLDTKKHWNTTDYVITQSRGNEIVREVKETHTMRFFFPLEIEYFLNSCGFDLLQLGSFPDYDNPVTDQTWNAIGIARRK